MYLQNYFLKSGNRVFGNTTDINIEIWGAGVACSFVHEPRVFTCEIMSVNSPNEPPNCVSFLHFFDQAFIRDAPHAGVLQHTWKDDLIKSLTTQVYSCLRFWAGGVRKRQLHWILAARLERGPHQELGHASNGTLPREPELHG